jgi:hypothetical protein
MSSDLQSIVEKKEEKEITLQSPVYSFMYALNRLKQKDNIQRG